MELNPATSKALDGWITPETWHTNHPLDMKRFYGFVDQYAKRHGHALDEASLQEEIVQRLSQKGKVGKGPMKVIQDRIILASGILDFLEQTNR